MSKKNETTNNSKPMAYDTLLCSVIIIFTHNLNTAELNSFFWLDEYGWCFDWYENAKDKEMDCKTYGLFPQDYIDQNGDWEQDIIKFLETKPKKAMEDIPLIEFAKWLNAT